MKRKAKRASSALNRLGEVVGKVIFSICLLGLAAAFLRGEFGRTGQWVTAVVLVLLVFGFIGDRRKKRAARGISAMSGEDFERFVADKLRRRGFSDVCMTPTTGDYGVDITATKGGVRYAFQCKRYSGSVGVHAVQEVYSGSKKYGADRAVVVTNSKYTPNAREMADDLGVSLWELEMLDAILD